MKKYSPEIAEYMQDYYPEKYAVTTRPKSKPKRVLIYDVECRYEYQNQPHDVTHSKVPLRQCPHCKSPNIRTTVRDKEIPVRRNGGKPTVRMGEVEPGKHVPQGIDEPTVIENRIIQALEDRPVATVDYLNKRIWNGHACRATVYATISRVRKKIDREIVMDRKLGGYRLESHE